MKKCLLILFSLNLFLLADTSKKFVISRGEQTQSVNALKEQLGESLKKAVHQVADLTLELATLQLKDFLVSRAHLQLEVATLQKKLLAQGEKLIENKGVYCKATKKDFIKADRQLIELLTALSEAQKNGVAYKNTTLTQKYNHITLFARE